MKKLILKLKLMLNKEFLLNLLKYLLIGGSAFVIEYTMFLLLRRVLHYLMANIIIYTLMFWTVFLANKFFNFKSRGNFKRQLLQYTTLYFVNLLVTNLLLYALSEFLMLDPAIGKFFVTGIACFWNFPLYKYVIYT